MLKLTSQLKLPSFLNRIYFGCANFWHSLNTSQRLYLVAMLTLFIQFNENEKNHRPNITLSFNMFSEPSMLLFIVLVSIAVVIELWPRLVSFIHTLHGKAITLLFYAFLANYALAHASGLINDITGVNAEHFPYTHNLSLMLSIPAWFFLSTLTLLIIVPFLQPFYIILLIVLRPFGLHYFWHKPDYRFPIITSIIRMVMCGILFATFVTFTVSTGIAANGIDPIVKSVAGSIFHQSDVTFGIIDENNRVQTKTTEVTQNTSQPKISIRVNFDEESPPTNDTDVTTLPNTPEEELVTSETKPLTEDEEHIKLVEDKSKKYEQYIKGTLAYFIYELEADSYSRCELTPHSRVIELNDFEILEIMRDPENKNNYTYTVKPCISAALGHQFKQQKQL